MLLASEVFTTTIYYFENLQGELFEFRVQTVKRSFDWDFLDY